MPSYKEKNNSRKNPWHSSFYYTDWQGKKKRKHKSGFARKKDADNYERHFLDKIAKTPDITLNALVDNYFEDMKNDKLLITTLKGKKERVEKKILPFLGDRPINTLEPLDITNWQNAIKNQGYKYSEDGYSDTYLRTIHNDLSSILNYAVKFYHLPSNPCPVAGAMGKSTADEMNIWTLDQFEHWIQFEDKIATRLAFNILYWSGCRVGECLALTPSDFLPDHSISITKNFAIVDGVEYFLPTKNKENRTVSIPGFLYDDVQQYIGLMYDLQPTDRLFYFGSDLLQKEMKRISNLANLDKIRIHDLRHSHASLLIEMGYNILVVSQRLGHKSVKITLDTYGHLYPGSDEKVAFGLQEAKYQGITTNTTTEQQLLSLLTEIKKSLPDYSSFQSDEIIFYNPESHQKYAVTREQFNTHIEECNKNPELQFAELIYNGYLEITPQAVYCLSSKGMPLKYL